MTDDSEPWTARTWQHWYRPWTVMHGSWASIGTDMLRDRGVNEHWLRLNYPAWCRIYAIDGSPADFHDSIWWRLSGLPVDGFERAVRLVGLTLTYSADQRRRLMRGGASVDMALVRWALARCHFVPQSVLQALRGDTHVVDATLWNAAATLRWCLQAEAPPLWRRMRLRCPRDVVQAQDDVLPAGVAPSARAHLQMLWSAALHHLQRASAVEEVAPSAQEDGSCRYN